MHDASLAPGAAADQPSGDDLTAGERFARDRRGELARFLRDRRARVRPDDVGLPVTARRRVPGLRREEVATLAGVGLTWYTMLESGTAENVSASTLRAIAGALRLDAGETAFLLRLGEDRTPRTPRAVVDDRVLAALAAIVDAPAYVVTSHWTVLAWNRAMSVVWGIEPPGGAPFDIVARSFADPAWRAMHGDRFPTFARTLVAMVRGGAAAHHGDKAYRRVAEVARRDPLFAELWRTYDVTTPVAATSTTVDSLVVGAFAYRTLTLDVPGDDGHWLVLQLPDAASAVHLRTALADAGQPASSAS